MGIVKMVADFFRSTDGKGIKPIEKYDIVKEISAVNDSVGYLQRYCALLAKDPAVTAVVTGQGKTDTDGTKAASAYAIFVKALSPTERNHEKHETFSVINEALGNISANLTLIEDNFNALFGSTKTADESTLKTSSLIVVGYLEMASSFVSWFSHMAAHLTASDSTVLIPPYWTKEILDKAALMGEFVDNNLVRWRPAQKGLLNEIHDLQRKGADVVINTGVNWLDDFVQDNQFNDSEQTLMTAALRNPIMMVAAWQLVRYEKKLALLEARKNWLLSKVALEEAKLNRMEDTDSAEYQRLRKVVDNYAVLVSKYEQKIERKRA